MRTEIVAGLVVLGALMIGPATKSAAQEDTTSSATTESPDAEARPSAERQNAVDPAPTGPAEYKVILEGLPEPAQPSGGGWLASAFVAAFTSASIAALVAVYRIRKEDKIQKRNEDLQLAAKQSQQQFDEAKLKMEHEFTALMQKVRAEHESTEADKGRTQAKKIHDERADHMRQQLRLESESFSAELEFKIADFVSQQRFEEARILNQYFDRLLHKCAKVRELALFALSNVVDSEVLEQIAASGSVDKTQRFLSKLASRGNERVRYAAQNILNDVVDDLQPSVVRVSTAGSEATGFLCQNNDLILCSALPAKCGDKIQVTSWTASGDRTLNATVLPGDENSQLMAAQLDSCLQTKPLTLLGSGAVSGLPNSDLTVLQWPRGKDFIARTGRVTETNARLPGEDTDQAPKRGTARPRYIKIKVETETERGVVGTPLVTESGEVAGMLAMSARKHSYAIGADTLDKFMQPVIKQYSDSSNRQKKPSENDLIPGPRGNQI